MLRLPDSLSLIEAATGNATFKKASHTTDNLESFIPWQVLISTMPNVENGGVGGKTFIMFMSHLPL